MGLHNRRRFLIVACLFEGALALAALGMGWLVDVDPLADLNWNARSFLVGAAVALPIFLLFTFSFQDPFLGLRGVRQILLRVLGPPLAACRWYHMLLLAVFAGVGEELLFRGLLQPGLERLGGYTVGLVVSNVVFGLAHAVTAAYALAAGLIGLLLGWLLDATGERNLLVPIATHTVYDFLAFLVVAATYRNLEHRGRLDETGDEIETNEEATVVTSSGPEETPQLAEEVVARPRTHVVAEPNVPPAEPFDKAG